MVLRDQVRRLSNARAHRVGRRQADHSQRTRLDRAHAATARRVGKIFIDYLRNGRSASTVAAFSVRARPGMAVSMPISWDELTDVKSGDQWTVAQAIHRQRTLAADPWED
ncbi:hypothetical protein [Caballeronia sp. LZ001]|uniref:non-homologous end-joining DNA ligase LigD n=1 Tax=Caballeronia sp. LZ001 TaxID=3038553 RepID=UPI0038D494EA